VKTFPEIQRVHTTVWRGLDAGQLAGMEDARSSDDFLHLDPSSLALPGSQQRVKLLFVTDGQWDACHDDTPENFMQNPICGISLLLDYYCSCMKLWTSNDKRKIIAAGVAFTRSEWQCG
jgi:hypothetical protein